MFSVALSVERSQLYKPGGPPGRYPAHCSVEFGLSSPLRLALHLQELTLLD